MALTLSSWRKLPALSSRLMARSRSIWAWWTSSWPRPPRQRAPTRTRGPWKAPLLLHGCEEPSGVLQRGSTGSRTCWDSFRSNPPLLGSPWMASERVHSFEDALGWLQSDSTDTRTCCDGCRSSPQLRGSSCCASERVHGLRKLLMCFRMALQAWRRTWLALDRVHRCAEALDVLQSGSTGMKACWVGIRSSPSLRGSSWCASEWFPAMPSWNQRSWPRPSTSCWRMSRLPRLCGDF